MPHTSQSSLQVAVGILRNPQGEVLIAQRPEQAHQGGLWEFPGGKLEPGEAIGPALARELHEEIGVDVGSSRPWLRVEHDYGDRRVLLDVHQVEAYSGEPWGKEGQPVAWVAIERLADYRFPQANQAIIRALGLAPILAITGSVGDDFEQRVERVLSRGAGLLQLRVPEPRGPGFEALAERILACCHAVGAKLVVNADPALAVSLRADGVQLNRQRLLAADQRPLGETRLVGASCHNVDELDHAAAIGADFALLSPVLPTASHPGAATLGWEQFQILCEQAPMPVYALGGMTTDSLELARTHGAHGIALLGALWNP
jgi:8-oxo-dGTP diphosphatase